VIGGKKKLTSAEDPLKSERTKKEEETAGNPVSGAP